MNIKIGISGIPGSGKTQALLEIIKMIEAEGVVVGGMLSIPIIEDGKRSGFYVENWTSKEKAVFAHINLTDSKIKYERYGVDLSALEKVGIPAIEYALERSDLIVIDEVGKIELESEPFIEVVKRVIESDKPTILTLHKKSRNPLLQEIRRKDDIRILEVTPINIKILPFKVIKLLNGEH
ncbi:MAG: NTPase [Candidatus Thermoplasmatota archaeon]|jgi:nucleoside-triphosphatase|nr:NTPase [Candidatus Thermoplasmatota archaeon]MCL5963286.1 NTPase [Candidatus Thermoplasmatota archaeon]